MVLALALVSNWQLQLMALLVHEGTIWLKHVLNRRVNPKDLLHQALKVICNMIRP